MTLEEFGLNAQRLIAGFSGGVVHALVFKQRDAAAVIASVLTGTLTANFLSPIAARYVGTWLGDGGCAFIVGLTAMAICQGMVSLVMSRMKGIGVRDQSKETRP